MQHKTTTRLTFAGLTTLLVLLSFSTLKLVGLDSSIQQLIDTVEAPVQTITQTVTRPDGSSAVISTPRRTNADGTAEAVADWRARHDAAVLEFKNN